jgi:transposase
LANVNDGGAPGTDQTSTFVGIDWGGSFHQVCVLNGTGTVVTRRRIHHTVEGLAELDELVSSLPGPVRVAIERAEGLLVEHLHGLDVAVFCVSPKISSRARERYRLAAAKSDSFDAFVLADTLRHEHAHWRPLRASSALTAQLRAVSRDRERVILAQRATESRLRAVLETYHPAPLHLFSSLDRDITLAFVTEYPTPEQAARVGPARMTAFCHRHGYSGRVDPAVLVERMRPHLLAAGAGTAAGKALTARLFASELAMLNDHLRVYDKTIRELLKTHPDTPVFTSFPGIGPVIAATLIGEMGDDRTRFPSAAALLAESGLAPVTRSSGRSHQVRFRYAANRRMRHAIDWWAFVATREDPWSHAIYEQARERGQSKYRALRGLGGRWTRILWRAWIDNTPYDPARHHPTEVIG